MLGRPRSYPSHAKAGILIMWDLASRKTEGSMDRLDAMAVLLTAVEEGSLSAASRRLRLPLATVSRKVADLEKHLRTQLIVRTSRRIELTDAGRAYVVAAKGILEQVDEAERAATG